MRKKTKIAVSAKVGVRVRANVVGARMRKMVGWSAKNAVSTLD